MLRGVEDDQLLKAKDVLKDELHPLRTELNKIARMVAAEKDEASVNAVIAEQLTPHLVDYRKAFDSRTATLLSATQNVARDVYLGTFIFGAALFATPDPRILAGVAGTSFGGAIADATARYLVERHKQDEAKARHPFGFLQYLEKK